MSIVRNYFNKSVPSFIVPELQNHLKNNSKSAEANALNLAVTEVHKKSKPEINSIKSKLR